MSWRTRQTFRLSKSARGRLFTATACANGYASAAKKKAPVRATNTDRRKGEAERSPVSPAFYQKNGGFAMITYLGAVALGFVLGAVFSAVGLLADRKGAQ